MKNYPEFFKKMQNHQGATAILIGIMIVVLLGFAALAVDIGYALITKNELQNVADAAALAAARQLGVIYKSMTYEEQQSYVVDTDDEVLIKSAATDVASQNKAAGTNIVINDDDIIVGTWDPSQTPDSLSPTLTQPDAVRVFARRDSSANGPISTFFARVFGINALTVTANATAALTGQGTSNPGDLELPVGISRWWFDNHHCNEYIKFSPSNDPDSCAGWTSWEYNSNDANLRKILYENPGYPSPETLAYDSIFNFIGGDLSNPTFDALLSLFQRKGYDVDSYGNPILDANGDPIHDATGTGLEVPLCFKADANDCAVPCDSTYATRLYYPDGTARNQHEWPTTVVVYDRDDCSNPNRAILIVGFAIVNMTNVCGPPYKLIKGIVLCSYVDTHDSRGGGGIFGVKGSIPGLVE